MSNSQASNTVDEFPADAIEKWESKSYSKFYDPCQEASKRSIKCLHRNPSDKSLCSDYFQAYRDCKKAWSEKLRAEKSKQHGGWS